MIANLADQAGWLVMVTSIPLANKKISRAELRLCFVLGMLYEVRVLLLIGRLNWSTSQCVGRIVLAG